MLLFFIINKGEIRLKDILIRLKNKNIIGLRIIKTVIAVALAAFSMRYIFNIVPFFACIGAVVAVEKTIPSSLEASVVRNVGTIVGGIVGIAISSFTDSIVLISLGVIPLILINNKLGKKESIVPGAIVYFAVSYLNTMDTAWIYGLKRIFGTLVGSLIGLAVNYFIFKPKEDKLKEKEES